MHVQLIQAQVLACCHAHLHEEVAAVQRTDLLYEQHRH